MGNWGKEALSAQILNWLQQKPKTKLGARPHVRSRCRDYIKYCFPCPMVVFGSSMSFQYFLIVSRNNVSPPNYRFCSKSIWNYKVSAKIDTRNGEDICCWRYVVVCLICCWERPSADTLVLRAESSVKWSNKESNKPSMARRVLSVCPSPFVLWKDHPNCSEWCYTYCYVCSSCTLECFSPTSSRPVPEVLLFAPQGRSLKWRLEKMPKRLLGSDNCWLRMTDFLWFSSSLLGVAWMGDLRVVYGLVGSASIERQFFC